MHPILFEIGPLTVRTYGFFLALGFLAGMFVIMREAKRQGLDSEKVLDICFYSLVAAIVASRAAYVAFNWNEQFAFAPLAMVRIWDGGLVFYGGFLGAVAVFMVFACKYQMPFFKLADIFALGVPLGHALGRLGCFSAGCCYGAPTDSACSVTFTHPLSIAPQFVALHPTQLYSAAGNLGIFLLLFLVVRKNKKWDGQILASYLALYAVFRFFIEFLRGDERGAFFLGILSPSQLVAAFMLFAAFLLYAFLRKSQKAA
ncbi:MAG: prolipoprotein diacylglyceryl transferase [Desulfatibacillaceae bacterium]|nr:prolipoprotein diacylglyceryl transferase [Desulfatibacillaceae bacterium]